MTVNNWYDQYGIIDPYYSDKYRVIVKGDCREVLPLIPDKSVDLVLTDPPQGITENSGRRLHAYKNPDKSKGRIGWSGMAPVTDYGDTTWDDTPLDDGVWRELTRISNNQIVWGMNHLWRVLGKPLRILVWDKKVKNGWNDSFSDCEFGWCSLIGPDKMFRHLWMGALRAGRRVDRVHPTQKPVELMEWCLSFFPTAFTLIDSYMGSGSTLVACKEQNRKCIGIEIEEKYCEIAANRCAADAVARIQRGEY